MKGESKKSIYNRAIRKVRVYLNEQCGIYNILKQFPLVQKFAEIKYGLVLKTRKDAYNWLIEVESNKELLGWPVMTNKAKQRRRRYKNLRKRKIPLDNNGRVCYKKYISSAEWDKIRKKVLKRDEYKCSHCGDDKTSLHVHHLTYANLGDEENHLEDLTTLCVKCHKKIHNR